jgi:hypothetical protein
MNTLNAQGQVWFGDGPAVSVQDRPDEIERMIQSARSQGSPFITLRSASDGETWRVNPDHIRRIAGPPLETAAPSTIKSPWG